MANGTIDLECGSTTNNLTRQKQVAFAPTHFITGTAAGEEVLEDQELKDLKGKTVVSTQGTTNIKALSEENQKQKLGMNFIAAKDHAESFLTVETGRAVAFSMDDILLYGLVANAKNPGDWVVGDDRLERPVRDHVPQGRSGVQEGRRRRGDPALQGGQINRSTRSGSRSCRRRGSTWTCR